MNYFATKVSEILAVLNDGDCLSSEDIYNDDRVEPHTESTAPNTYEVFCEALAHLVDEKEVVQSGDLYTLAPDPDGNTELDAEYAEYLSGLSSESRANVERLNAKTGEQLYEMVDERTDDSVNHPSHYTQGRKYETIDVIEDWDLGYHLGQVIKYVSRAGRKGDLLEDLNKAAWYLARHIENLEAGK
jgi:hypothetical protein